MRSIAVIFVTLTTAKRSFEETHEGKTCQKAYLYFLCDCVFFGYWVASSSLTEHIELVHES